jgi:hypothetical protein
VRFICRETGGRRSVRSVGSLAVTCSCSCQGRQLGVQVSDGTDAAGERTREAARAGPMKFKWAGRGVSKVGTWPSTIFFFDYVQCKATSCDVSSRACWGQMVQTRLQLTMDQEPDEMFVRMPTFAHSI